MSEQDYLAARQARELDDISKGLRARAMSDYAKKQAAKKVAAGTLAGSMALTGGVGAVKAAPHLKQGVGQAVTSVDRGVTSYARDMGNTYGLKRDPFTGKAKYDPSISANTGKPYAY